MLWKNIKLVLLVVLCFFCFAGQVYAQNPGWYMVYGDILQVLPEQNKILVKTEAEKQILVLANDCTILREGQRTTLRALRPIFEGSYQDALCWIDSKGFIRYILVNYQVQEEQGTLLNYDIFGNLK